MSQIDFTSAWKKILHGFDKPWVLFQFGTCVIIREPSANLTDQAIALLKEWGYPTSGSPANKFSLSFLSSQGLSGSLVSCHHPDILTYVAPAEAPISEDDEISLKLSIGGFGRKKRQWDCETLKVIYIESSYGNR